MRSTTTTDARRLAPVVARAAMLALLALCLPTATTARAINAAAPATTLLPENATFSSVVNCSPLRLLIQPGPTYALEAHPAVVPTLTTDGALHLGVRSFNASTPVLLRVSLPADALKRVVSSSGPITVAPAFNSTTLSIINIGASTLYVSGLINNASHVSVENSGAGAVVVDSAIRSAAVQGAGTSATFIRGVSRRVEVDLVGMARVAVEPATTDALITGRTSGMASVQLTRGRCGVASDNGGFFGPPCAPVAGVRLPVPVTDWSCGLAVSVDGVLGCDAAAGRNAVVLGGGGVSTMGGNGGGSFISTGTGGGGGGFVSTSGGGGGTSFMTSTSGGGGGGSFVSTGGNGGNGVFMTSNGGSGNGGNFYTINADGSVSQAPVQRAPTCTATAEEVKMTLATAAAA